MKISGKSIVFFLLLLTSSLVIIIISIIISIGLTDLPGGFNHIIIYIGITITTAFALSKKNDYFTSTSVIITIGLSWLILFVPKAISSSINFTLNAIPFFISFLLAITGGFIYHKRRALKFPIILGVIPLLLTIGFDAIWYNNIAYGSPSGELEFTKAPAFSLIDKNNRVINNGSIVGKVVILDFWFIGCRPCWAKFPKLQQIYDKYQANEQILVYAVNRPMKNDKPNQLFTSIEEKNYTFPVVRGSQQIMDDFGINYYPTVVIIDPDGNLIFRGAIEKVEEVIEDLLKNKL